MSSLQSTDFRIRHAYIETPQSSTTYDLSGIFQEINFYDNLFMPCMSGNILIVDALNLRGKLSIDGDEIISFYIDKGDNNLKNIQFRKEFVIYRISNEREINKTSKSYILHFISAEFWKSERMRIKQSYRGLYSDFVKNILVDKLAIPDSSPTNGRSGIGSFFPSINQQKIVVPNLTPFQTIEWITQRAIPNNNHKKYPEYVFYENQFGYNFMPLSELLTLDPIFEINFSPKNVSDAFDLEFLGVRDFKIKSMFNGIQNTMAGVYGGKFIGFDPITRKKQDNNVTFKQIWDSLKHANRYPLLPLDREEQEILTSPDSRVVTHPYMLPRRDSTHIIENDRQSLNTLILSEDFAFQRKSIIFNLLQRRIEFTIPGNFFLASGYMVKLNFPKFKFMEKSDNKLDEEFTGKYIITGARHIIRFGIHETMVEVATDSTNKNVGTV